MIARPLPSYLKVVPPPSKRFRRPRKASVPLPLERNDVAIARLIRQTEFVQEIVDRLRNAVWANDEIVVKAVLERLNVEARCAAGFARGLREGVLCA